MLSVAILSLQKTAPAIRPDPGARKGVGVAMGLTLETLTLKALQDAVAGQAAAIRIITKLQPVGG